ncbi:MAG: transcription antitermination factor NusB [Atopobiaceae bacterium]|nr:transcription antitermination factor NusB [Atopobiaceae bacterium]
MQLLFQAEANKVSVARTLAGEYLISEGPLDGYARDLALGCDLHLEEIDGIIARASENWSVERMVDVDRCLLRIAVYELLYEDDVEPAVAIDECVELAKAYGTEESSRFINGVLGRIAQDLETRS